MSSEPAGILPGTLDLLILKGPPGHRMGTSENNRRAKYDSLTTAGRRRLREQTDGWNRMVGIMGAALNTRRGEV